MAEKIDDRLKVEVEKYNELNEKKKELEIQVGRLNQEMLKIIGKIELLQELNEKGKKSD
jgi:peptidoglycan hydrolase CwlO-like protein